MTYDTTGKRIRTENLAGQATTTAWDCCHKVSETRPDGFVTTWDYDDEDRLVASSRLIPLDMTNVTWLTTCYAYDVLGRLTSAWTTNRTAHVGLPATTTAYDRLGRVASRTAPGRGTSLTAYSDDGLVVTNTAPNGATTITRRNADGDTLSVIGSGVTPEFHSYGILPDGTRWTKTVEGEAADSPRFTKRYENLLGQVVREERSGFRGALLATVHAYDGYGRLVTTTADGEPTTEYTYDNQGTRVATTRTVGSRVPRDRSGEWRKSESQLNYALVDSDVWSVQTNIASCSDAAIAPLVQSRATVYEYDLRGRKTYEGGATYPVRYAYDVFGNKIAMTTYRDESQGADSGDTTRWLYDIASNCMTNKIYADGKGPSHRTIEQFTWSYLPGSDLKSSLAYPNGLTASWSYDAAGRLLQVCNVFPTNVVSQFDYTCDAAGRRVACAKSGSAFSTPDAYDYLYNARSELTNATAAVDSAYRYGYQFDDIGNRRSSLERGVQSAEYTANNLNQYTAVDDFVSFFAMRYRGNLCLVSEKMLGIVLGRQRSRRRQ